LIGSLWVLTQVPLHTVSPGGQVPTGWQVPPVQSPLQHWAFEVQVCPFWRQGHCPLTQAVPGGHWFPHAPQLFGSLATLTHAPLGQITELGPQTHVPLTQTSVAGQARPH